MEKIVELDGMKFCKNEKTGYFLSSVKKDGKRIRLHRYVYEKYNGKIPKGFDVHHIDHDKNNNHIDNLELLSKKEHLQRHGLELTEEQKEAKRNNLIENAIPKASEWHKSEAGRRWHKTHYESMKDKFHKSHGVKICEVCGKEFEAKTANQRFCSNNCKSAYRRKSGVDNILCTCPICGKEFYANKYSSRKYCSNECKYEARKNKKYRKGGES